MIDVSGLWSVFGPNADQFFRDGAPDPDHALGLADLLSDQGYAAALKGLSLHLPQDVTTVIQGPSGCGKSVLVRSLLRLIEPVAGTISLDGEDLTAAGPSRLRAMRVFDFGLVMQRPGLLPHLSVLGNVAFPLRVRGIGKAEREKQAREILDRLDLAHLQGKSPHQLDREEQMFVAMGRSLVAGPRIWLLDSPLSSLEGKARASALDRLQTIVARTGRTVVITTESLDEALTLGDRIAIMENGQIHQVGAPDEILMRPANHVVASRVAHVPRGRMMVIDGMIEPVASLPNQEGPILRRGMSVDEAVLRAAGGIGRLRVADSSGRIIGFIRTQRLVGSLDNSEPRKSA